MGLLNMQTNTLSSPEKLRSTKNISTSTIFFMDISLWVKLPLCEKTQTAPFKIKQ